VPSVSSGTRPPWHEPAAVGDELLGGGGEVATMAGLLELCRAPWRASSSFAGSGGHGGSSHAARFRPAVVCRRLCSTPFPLHACSEVVATLADGRHSGSPLFLAKASLSAWVADASQDAAAGDFLLYGSCKMLYRMPVRADLG